MTDETDDADDEAAEARTRSRLSAQHAAGDLARMGIDPRSLGLDAPDQAETPVTPPPAESAEYSPPEPEAVASETPAARIVPLRPEFADDGRQPPSSPTPAVHTAPADPPQPDGGHRYGPVEELLARTISRRPAPRSPSRVLKAVSLGLITPDAAEASGEERELVAAVRHRQTERRIVSFMAGKGGVGTTTVASGVGAVLSALRDDHAVLVDAQPGTASLAGLHGLPDPITVRGLLRTGGEGAPVRTAGGLGIVDGVGWEQPLSRRDVVNVVDRVGADNTFTLLDVGDEPGEAAHASLARCDQAVLVSTIGEVGLRAMEVSLARLRQVNPRAVERAVFVLVSQHNESHRRTHHVVVEQLRVAPARVVVVPPDPTLQQGQPFDPSRVTAATRAAMVEVAAAVAVSGGGQ